MKGYKLYDLVTRKFITSSDVLFHEDIFPFHTFTQANHNPFPDILLPSHSNPTQPIGETTIPLPSSTSFSYLDDPEPESATVTVPLQSTIPTPVTDTQVTTTAPVTNFEPDPPRLLHPVGQLEIITFHLT